MKSTVFDALADPVRPDLLERLRERGPASLGELAVHEVEAPTQFVWPWKDAGRADPIETTVSFRLTARDDGGTTLLVREVGFLDDEHRSGNVQGGNAETDELVALPRRFSLTFGGRRARAGFTLRRSPHPSAPEFPVSRRPLALLSCLLIVPAFALVSAQQAEARSQAHVTGTVTDDQGLPLANTAVLLEQQEGTTWSFENYAVTGTTGHYSLSLFAAGATYRVEFGGNATHASQWWQDVAYAPDATPFTIADGEQIAGIDAGLGPASTITGTVLGPAEMSRGGNVNVTLYGQTAGGWAAITHHYDDVSGHFVFDRLVPGTYRLGYQDTAGHYLDGFYDAATSLEAATDIVVPEDSSVEADLTPVDASHITGQLSDAGGGSVEDETATAYQLVGGSWQAVSEDAAQDGAFDIGGLQPGTYRVGFTNTRSTYLDQYYDDASTIEAASDITVAAGQSAADIDATLQRNGGVVTGRVTDDAGRGIAGVEVYRYFDDDGVWFLDSATHLETKPDGTYTMPFVPTGTYHVCFVADDRSVYQGRCWKGAADVDHGTDVVVTVGSTTSGIDASLPYSTTVRNTAKPAISGKARVGRTLSVSAGTWTPARPTLTYQWRANGVAIARATHATFKLTAKQQGKRITVAVVARATACEPGSAVTAATAKVTKKG